MREDACPNALQTGQVWMYEHGLPPAPEQCPANLEPRHDNSDKLFACWPVPLPTTIIISCCTNLVSSCWQGQAILQHYRIKVIAAQAFQEPL